MTTDARLNVGLPNHPKTRKLIKRIGQAGAWNLICLFLWTAQNKPDGDLSGMSDEDLELASDWLGVDGELIINLVAIGFIEGESGQRKIHDWAEHNPYAAGVSDRKSKARYAGLVSRYGKKKADEMFHVGQANSQLPVDLESTTSQLTVGLKQESSTTPSPSPSPSPSPLPEPKEKKPRKRGLPENFGISDAVRQWAQSHGFGRLPERLEFFVGYVKANGKTYTDWDQAFQNSIRGDWAKLNGNGSFSRQMPEPVYATLPRMGQDGEGL